MKKIIQYLAVGMMLFATIPDWFTQYYNPWYEEDRFIESQEFCWWVLSCLDLWINSLQHTQVQVFLIPLVGIGILLYMFLYWIAGYKIYGKFAIAWVMMCIIYLIILLPNKELFVDRNGFEWQRYDPCSWIAWCYIPTGGGSAFDVFWNLLPLLLLPVFYGIVSLIFMLSTSMKNIEEEEEL